MSLHVPTTGLQVALVLLLVSQTALSQQPTLIAQVGHADLVKKIVFALDSRILISGEQSRDQMSEEAPVKIWELGSGRLLRTLPHAVLVAVTPDGKTLCTLEDNELKLRDILSWKVNLSVPISSTTGRVSIDENPIAFSADSKTLFRTGFNPTSGSAKKDFGVQAWNLLDNTCHFYPIPESEGMGARFSIHGKYLALAHRVDDKDEKDQLERIEVFSVGTRAYDVTLPAGRSIYDFSFSPDEALLIAHFRPRKGGGDHTFSFWENATGRKLASFERNFPDLWEITCEAISKTCVEFNSDWSLAHHKSWMTTFSLESGKVLDQRELLAIDQKKDRIDSAGFELNRNLVAGVVNENLDVVGVQTWDARSGQPLHRFSFKGGGLNNGVEFSPDGNLIACWDASEIRVWKTESAEQVFSSPGYSTGVDKVAFSPGDKFLAIDQLSSVNILNLTAGVMTGRVDGAFKAFSPDGSTLVTESDSFQPTTETTFRLKTLLWNPDSATKLGEFRGAFVSLSEDNTRLITKDDVQGIALWDVAKHVAVRNFGKISGDFGLVVVSPDFKILAMGVGGRAELAIELIEIDSGRKLYTLKPPTKTEFNETAGAFSNNGKLFACTWGEPWDQHRIGIWKTETGETLRVIEGTTGMGVTVAFTISDDAVIGTGNDVEKWSVRTGKHLYAMDVGSFVKNTAEWSATVVMSDDGAFMAGLFPGGPLLVDNKTGKLSPTIKLTEANDLAFSHNNKTIATVANDGVVTLWDVSSGMARANLLELGKDDWMVVASDGRFDGTPPAWRNILWRFGQNLFDASPVETFFNEYFDPGLLAEVLGGQFTPLSSAASIAERDRRQPVLKMTLAETELREPIGSRLLGLKIEMKEAHRDQTHSKGSGAQDLRLFRNGSLVKVWHGDAISNPPQGCKSGTDFAICEATVPIVAGENDFTAYAFNHDNVKSNDAQLVIHGAETLKRKGTAYVVAVGINEYANRNFKLSYAVPDADDFASEIKRQQELLNHYEKIEIIPLFDKEATKENIVLALKLLGGRAQMPATAPESLKQIKRSEPEDLVVIYFAGHGTAHDKEFYLIPHDLGYDGARSISSNEAFETLLTHSISDVELQNAFEEVDAGHLLLVIDACNSGQALEAAERRRAPMNSKGLAQLAYEKGMYILTASQSYQSALEVSELKHGLLTFVLVEEGLKQAKAEKNSRGEITERKWLDYATQRVPEKQLEKLKREPTAEPAAKPGPIRKRRRGSKLVLAVDENPNSDPEKSAVQRPRVFYRRELESQPLIMARQ